DNEDAARWRHELVTIKPDSPVKMTLEEKTYDGYEYKDIYTHFSELEFNSLLNRLGGKGEEIEDTTFDEFPLEVEKEVRKDIYTVVSELEFSYIINRVSGNGEEIEETIFDELHLEVLKEVRKDIFTGNEALLVEMLDDNYHYSPVEAIDVSNESGNSVMTKET